ncbi:hypothetical protein AEGHOMDF_1739 [Methylobacterium soli]|nr:hypothetical protein AEGHOMDF_1739 [Methylobacterium soli]
MRRPCRHSHPAAARHLRAPPDLRQHDAASLPRRGRRPVPERLHAFGDRQWGHADPARLRGAGAADGSLRAQRRGLLPECLHGGLERVAARADHDRPSPAARGRESDCSAARPSGPAAVLGAGGSGRQPRPQQSDLRPSSPLRLHDIPVRVLSGPLSCRFDLRTEPSVSSRQRDHRRARGRAASPRLLPGGPHRLRNGLGRRGRPAAPHPCGADPEPPPAPRERQHPADGDPRDGVADDPVADPGRALGGVALGAGRRRRVDHEQARPAAPPRPALGCAGAPRSAAPARTRAARSPRATAPAGVLAGDRRGQ